MQLCLKRQAVLTIRNVAMIKSRIMQVIVGGFLLGSLYFQVDLSDYNSSLGVVTPSIHPSLLLPQLSPPQRYLLCFFFEDPAAPKYPQEGKLAGS